MKKEFLIQRSNECRKEILKMVYNASSGHIGGAFSAIDIMVYLYFEKMNFSKNNFTDINRDRFILSKGHASAALYSCLAFKEIISFEELSGFRKIDRMLQGHPSRKTTPGVETSTGSLGQGLSFANGCALGLKIKNINSKIYCMVGDGEINEGQFWEALMTSSRYNLENLRVILDYNHLQIDGKIEDIKNPSPSRKRFESFNYHVIEINGHDFNEIEKAFTEADLIKGMPVFIIAHTTKGKGVSFMENNVDFHGTPPKKDEFEKAMKELENG